MFLSIKELDLEKEPQALEEVKKGMNLEGGMIIFLEDRIEAAPLIQFQKKGRHLEYF
jgi:hypothetical protein